MAESTDDKQVDSAIARMQALLDELKSAQAKDVEDESGDVEGGEYKGKNLKEAGQEAYTRVRAHNRRLRKNATQSGEPDSDDGVK
jgi:hypothetical protein